MTEIYSKYELVNPSWLNKDFMEEILKSDEKDDGIKVLELDITPATLKNDHYGSVMYRTKVKYQTSKNENKSISLIVKTMPDYDCPKKDMMQDTFIFRTEIRMYSETIPKMEAILRKYGDDTILGAKAYYTASYPNDVLVFEDLVEKGYTSIQNRFPNEEEIKKALMKIAKWHAASYILAIEEPEAVTNYNDGVFTIDMEKIDFFTTAIKNFISQTLTADEELKSYIPIFEKLDETLLQKCIDIWHSHKRGEKGIFVLNHGDFHFKNMMFKHKPSGELDDLMLVDFQTCYYGPVATDIMYATFMLMDGDTRWSKRDELISYYFNIFTESLRKFEFKGEIPKMADFQIELIKNRAYETFMVAAVLPIVGILANDTVALEAVIESPEDRLKMYSNPALTSEVKRTLRRYLHIGNLEF